VLDPQPTFTQNGSNDADSRTIVPFAVNSTEYNVKMNKKAVL